jgi:hypothetical protein
MKLSVHELDAEIAEIEASIAAERLALKDAVAGCTNSLRDTVASPKTLLALTGLGFAAGKFMFGRSKPPQVAPVAKKAGILGVITGLAGTALSLAQPKFGVGTIARWAASRAFSGRKSKTAGVTPQTNVSSTTGSGSRGTPSAIRRAVSSAPTSTTTTRYR